MNPNDLERTYESLACKIDQVGKQDRELFLAKLVLLLAKSNGDVEQVHQHIEEAAYHLVHADVSRTQ